MTHDLYITTAIDYVNATPHIGTAYEKIGADVLARFRLLQGLTSPPPPAKPDGASPSAPHVRLNEQP